MTRSTDPDRPVTDPDLLQEAARRVAQMRGPEAEKHRAALDAWLAADPNHRTAFNRMTEIFTLGRGLSRPVEVRGSQGHSHRKELILAGGIALVLVVGVGGALLRAPEQIRGNFASQDRAATALRQNIDPMPRVMRLTDGSVIVLDQNARIETAFSEEKRIIRLVSGRVRFDVAHEARPFIVVARGGTVTAHGTLFDVSIVGERIDVHLIRGVVDVAAVSGDGRRRDDRMLHAGDGATVSTDGAVRLPAAVRADDWISAVIDIDGATLSDVVAQANARSVTRIALVGKDTAAKRVSGRFHIDDADRLASQLASLFDLQEARTGPGEITLSPARAK